jgi:hypothetical protein
MYADMLTGFEFGCSIHDCELIGNWPLPEELKANALNEYYESGATNYGSGVSPYALLADGGTEQPKTETPSSPQKLGVPKLRLDVVISPPPHPPQQEAPPTLATPSAPTPHESVKKSSKIHNPEEEKAKLLATLTEFHPFGDDAQVDNRLAQGDSALLDDHEFISNRLSVCGNQVKDAVKIVDHRKSLACHSSVPLDNITSVTISKRQSNIHEYSRKKSLPKNLQFDDDSSDEDLDPYAELERLAAEADK